MTTQRAVEPAGGSPASSILVAGRDPRRVIEEATRIASALAEVVERQQLYVDIGDGRHLQVEAWQTCGWFLGVTAEATRIEDIVDEDGRWAGTRAYAVALKDGVTISGGTGICLLEETNWEDKDRFQLESMAQTRAIAKALRNALAWVVVLAGFKPTPAEEMTGRVAEDLTIPKCPTHPTRKPKAMEWGNKPVWKCTGKTGGAWCTWTAPREITPPAAPAQAATPDRTAPPADDITWDKFWAQARAFVPTAAKKDEAVRSMLGVTSMEDDWIAKGRTRTQALYALHQIEEGRDLPEILAELDERPDAAGAEGLPF